jgi:hypothetical protein
MALKNSEVKNEIVFSDKFWFNVMTVQEGWKKDNYNLQTSLPGRLMNVTNQRPCFIIVYTSNENGCQMQN